MHRRVEGALYVAERLTPADRIVRLAAGTPLDVTGRTQASGRSWFRVVLPDNRWGFVRNDVVEHSGRTTKQ